jgi:hypothetical protein
MQANLHRMIIPLVALVAVRPMLLHGPSCGHDFDFHLLSWLEAATQLTHGGFPHWAFTPGWNAGEPRFLFYPPLSWLLGAVLGMLFPWTLVPGVFTWIVLTLAGLTMHRFARNELPRPSALLAATLYCTNPYMLFTAYERTAYGELVAAALIPLLLAALLAKRLRLLPIALAVWLIWLANAPAGVMCCYALALLALVRLARPSPGQTRAQIAIQASAGVLLGLALAGAYLVPALVEQSLISPGLATVPGMRIVDNTLFHQMPASVADAAVHDQVLHTASLIALFLLVVSFACMLYRVFRRGDWPIAPLCLVAAIAFLLTPLSLLVWSHLPELGFLQFPWRLLALVAPIYAWFAASCVPPKLSWTLPAAILLAVLAAAAGWHVFQQPCDVEDAPPARVALFHSNLGTEATDEYTPAGADGDALHPGNPPYWQVPAAPRPAGKPVDDGPPANAAPGPAPHHLGLKESAPAYLILNRREYPLWQLRLNGRIIAPDAIERTDGLIDLLLPPGTDTVDLNEVRTPDEDAGVALSLVAGSLAIFLWRRKAATRQLTRQSTAVDSSFTEALPH